MRNISNESNVQSWLDFVTIIAANQAFLTMRLHIMLIFVAALGQHGTSMLRCRVHERCSDITILFVTVSGEFVSRWPCNGDKKWATALWSDQPFGSCSRCPDFCNTTCASITA